MSPHSGVNPADPQTERELLLLLVQKVDTLKTTVDDNHTTTVDRLNGYSTRIKSLENWRTFLAGAWSVLGLGGYVAFESLKEKISK